MPELKLEDRTFEDSDGTWTNLTFRYCHPWENGEEADIAVTIETFKRKADGKFDFTKPDGSKFFYLHEMEATMLHGFLGAAVTLMPRQWADYRAQEAEEKARTQKAA